MKQLFRITILLFITSLIGCIEPLDEAAIKTERIEKKKKEYHIKRINQCKLEATEEAEMYVDSLIANWVGHEVMDTISFPDRPIRPTRPEDIIGTVPKFDVNSPN